LPGGRGFTLIELLVVLAVLAAMAAMVMPSLGNAVPHRAVGAATAEIRAALRMAAAQAVAEGRTVRFRSDAVAGYWLDGAHRQLATGSDPALRLRIVVAGSGIIAFFPWGGSSGGRVWIENGRERRAIDVDAVSAHAIARP